MLWDHWLHAALVGYTRAKQGRRGERGGRCLARPPLVSMEDGLAPQVEELPWPRTWLPNQLTAFAEAQYGRGGKGGTGAAHPPAWTDAASGDGYSDVNEDSASSPGTPLGAGPRTAELEDLQERSAAAPLRLETPPALPMGSCHLRHLLSPPKASSLFGEPQTGARDPASSAVSADALHSRRSHAIARGGFCNNLLHVKCFGRAPFDVSSSSS